MARSRENFILVQNYDKSVSAEVKKLRRELKDLTGVNQDRTEPFILLEGLKQRLRDEQKKRGLL